MAINFVLLSDIILYLLSLSNMSLIVLFSPKIYVYEL